MAEIKKNTVTIGGAEYTLKAGMKAMIIYEKLTDQPFGLKNTTDVVSYIYSALLAGTPGMKLGLDELLDAVDEDPKLLQTCVDLTIKPTAADKVIELSNQPDNEGGAESKKE